jgi:hypothetical protein
MDGSSERCFDSEKLEVYLELITIHYPIMPNPFLVTPDGIGSAGNE